MVAAYRLFLTLMHVLRGLLIIALIFPRLGDTERQMRAQIWSRQMLRVLGITLQVQGRTDLSGPLLLVANHISWLDITALHASRFCRFVAKSDVRAWPLIGMLAAGVGTLFIQRESRRDAMRVVHHMAEQMQAGDVLAVFPEGTTSDGRTLLPFHGNLLQAAIAAEAPVQPIALYFLDQEGQMSFAPCYVGDESLMTSLWRTLTTPGITVVLNFGEVQTAQGRTRQVWAHDLRETITRMRASVT
jgi:1-acyl-sn-glycerol-3-phosphate acyltransferase